MIAVDCASGIFLFKSMTTKNVLLALEDCIKRHGKPKQILTDNGSDLAAMEKGKTNLIAGVEIRAYIILEVEYINQQQLEKWKDFTIQ